MSIFSIFLITGALSSTIFYDGTGTVPIQTQDEWGIIYDVGQWCDGIFEVELTIDLVATSQQADAVFAFGTETTYFAVFIGYDGSFWIPYPQVEGDIWVLPDPGLPLTVDTVVPLSDPSKLGDVSQGNANTPREGLTVPMGILTQWERLFCCGGPFAQNISPFKIKVNADPTTGTTIVTFNKGTATQVAPYISAFPKDTPIKLYIASDSGDIRLTEVFELHSIEQTGTPSKLCPGTPSEPPECECPCYCVIPDDRDYCSSGCCQVGLAVKTLSGSPVKEYFLDESNQECFTSTDGVESERVSLTQAQYCACEALLGDAANDANCSISEIHGKSILTQLSELFDENDISYFLVICYGLFIILSLATVIFLLYQCIKCTTSAVLSIANIKGNEYKQLNHVVTSAVETDN